jgi:ABC-2 type transport system ATP-binding protein
MGGTVSDTIRIFAELKNSDPSNALKLIDHFQLGSILRKKLFQLSSGEQKMIGNILAMSFSPSIILLDEPFDNVDQSRRIKLIRLLKEVKSDILLNTHELNLLNYLDGWSLYFILDGQIYGKFNTGMLKELYVSKGDVPGNLGLIESDIGKFSITINGGDIPISSVSNLNSLFDEVSL